MVKNISFYEKRHLKTIFSSCVCRADFIPLKIKENTPQKHQQVGD